MDLDGVNFKNLRNQKQSLLTNLRQLAFHEWNHCAEKEVIEEEKLEKYNPDDLFKKEKFQNNVNEMPVISIVKYKESAINKIISKIKNLLKNIF